MRSSRGPFGLALLLAFGLAGGVRADDEQILKGGNLLTGQTQTQQTGTQQTQSAATSDDETLPPDVEADLRSEIASLEQQVAEMKKDLADLKAAQAKDEKSFQAQLAAANAKLAQLQKAQSSGGIAGKLGQVAQVEATGGSTASAGQSQAAAPANGSEQGTTSATPAKPAAPAKPAQPSFLEKLILAIARGLGQGIDQWVRNRMGLIGQNANAASAQLGNRYPQYAAPINTRIQNALSQAIDPRTGMPVAPPQARPVPPAAARPAVPQRFVPLPVVTDQNGTHPMINLELGVGTDN